MILANIYSSYYTGAKVLQSCPTVYDPVDYSAVVGSSVHGDSPGKNIGVGCHALLQKIFPTQGRSFSVFCIGRRVLDH